MKILVYIVLLFALVNTTLAEESTLNGNQHPLKSEFYYIKIFKRLFPIPVRYAVVAPYNIKSKNPQSIKLSSPLIMNNYSLDNSKGKVVEINIVGKINIDVFNSVKERNNMRRNLEADLNFISKIELYGLDVEQYEGRYKSKWVSTTLVIITDGKQYISIVDSDSDLWRKLLDQYGKFNGIEENERK